MKNYKNCPNCFCAQPQDARLCTHCRRRFPAENNLRRHIRTITLTASSTAALVITAVAFFYLGSISNQNRVATPKPQAAPAQTERTLSSAAQTETVETEPVLAEQKIAAAKKAQESDEELPADDAEEFVLSESTETLTVAQPSYEVKYAQVPQFEVRTKVEEIQQTETQNSSDEKNVAESDEEEEETTGSTTVVPNYPAYPSYTPGYTPNIDRSSTESTSVRGYYRKNGTYVAPYNRSKRDNTTLNNWSTKGNVNPYTKKRGTKRP